MSLSALLAGNQPEGGDHEENAVPEHVIHTSTAVRRRLGALKKLHLDAVDVQIDFYKRVHELETEFRSRFEAVNKKRAEIVNGEREPADDEKDTPVFSWMSAEDNEQFLNAAPKTDEKEPKGVPEFWLNVLRQIPSFNDVVTDADEPILRHLTDITIDQTNEPPAFTVKFHFSENPYFSNDVLTKYYKISIGNNEVENKALYDGPSIVETKGCEIQWKEGKNVTQKLKKNKKGNNTKVVDAESFFTFFNPNTAKIHPDMAEEEADRLNGDFELGQLLRDSVVDSAVIFYTGECVDDDDEFDYGAGEEGEYEDLD
ncbi:Nucleosome assembly protein 1-like 1 [Aphelenchoides fujianensis]|nr:Nucleosome assembly protein 1-like 1 [Aphelenchoides fujianensis]